MTDKSALTQRQHRERNQRAQIIARSVMHNQRKAIAALAKEINGAMRQSVLIAILATLKG